jgi:hypothetical protein
LSNPKRASSFSLETSWKKLQNVSLKELGDSVYPTVPALNVEQNRILTSIGAANMKSHRPLYNSRIFQTYVDYLGIAHPDLKAKEILEHSGMTLEEVADSAHWFTQRQADRFFEIVANQTGDP